MVGSASDLRGQRQLLLDRVISLADFQRWVAQHSAQIELHGDDEAIDTLWLVENRLAEYALGHVEAEDVLQALAEDALDRQSVEFAFAPDLHLATGKPPVVRSDAVNSNTIRSGGNGVRGASRLGRAVGAGSPREIRVIRGARRQSHSRQSAYPQRWLAYLQPLHQS